MSLYGKERGVTKSVLPTWLRNREIRLKIIADLEEGITLSGVKKKNPGIEVTRSGVIALGRRLNERLGTEGVKGLFQFLVSHTKGKAEARLPDTTVIVRNKKPGPVPKPPSERKMREKKPEVPKQDCRARLNHEWGNMAKELQKRMRQSKDFENPEEYLKTVAARIRSDEVTSADAANPRHVTVQRFKRYRPAATGILGPLECATFDLYLSVRAAGPISLRFNKKSGVFSTARCIADDLERGSKGVLIPALQAKGISEVAVHIVSSTNTRYPVAEYHINKGLTGK